MTTMNEIPSTVHVIRYHDRGEAGVDESTDLDKVAQDAGCFAVMSSGEKQMLRALAVLAARSRVLFAAYDAFSSVSDRSFVADWCKAVFAS